MPTIFQNPVTKEEFDTKEAYVQSLIDSYQKAKREQYNWSEDEGKCLEALDAEVSLVDPNLKKGRVKLAGTTQSITVERKLNASYPKDRGAEHPLRKLMPQFDELGKLVNVEYKEKGAQIQGLLDRLRDGKLRPDDNEELARALLEVRIEKPAKVSIKVEDRIDVPSGAEGADGAAAPVY